MAEPRVRLSAPERRSQLLSVAGRLFAEQGFHGLSMEQLAEAAGVSKPVLYQHFPSKRVLYLALVTDAITELEAQVRKALEGTSDNKARVEGAIGAYFDFVEDQRFALLFGTAELNDTDVREAVEGALSRVADDIGQLIADDAGLSPDAAQFLASGVRGLATEGARWWVEHRDVEKADAVRLLSRLVWRGLGAFRPGAAH
ncbi:MAG TPA: TetR/AcrR family transcriptional regulator [Egibacteraceae bacterium]|nr:TetR/AcrR family transcriptional regulator [Egibacteraceae bacterium]